MNVTKSVSRLLTLLLAVVMVCGLTACGAKDTKKMTDMQDMPETTASMTEEEMDLEAAMAKHQMLMEQELKILSENTELWDKVFLEADKGMAMIEDGKNYGEFLLDTIEKIKDQFTEAELMLLKAAAEQISQIEKELTQLEEQYPSLSDIPPDEDPMIPMMPDDGDMEKFPAFTGKDLDGKDVTSGDIFSQNAVTVVNFWFTTCGPCVGELEDLDALNRELAEKGGAVIGINAFTLDGDEKAIQEAKELLMKKGAAYQNVYFPSDSEAGRFAAMVYAFPTTYVVDRSGNIVGDPIIGAITSKSQEKALKAQIDQALSADMS